MGRPKPDPQTVAELLAVVATPKTWISGPAIPWMETGGMPRGYKFRAGLQLPTGLQPEGLFVEAYFKPSRLDDPKLCLSLFFRGYRILGLDEDGQSRHVNEVGQGMQFFQQKVGFPHMHFVVQDAIYGYAEPLAKAAPDAYWGLFLSRARIEGGPTFSLPVVQGELL